MWLNVIALLLLGFFAGVGALRGALASGMSLLSLAVAYATGFWAAPAYGDRVAQALGAPTWLGFPLAGSLGFLRIARWWVGPLNVWFGETEERLGVRILRFYVEDRAGDLINEPPVMLGCRRVCFVQEGVYPPLHPFANHDGRDDTGASFVLPRLRTIRSQADWSTMLPRDDKVRRERMHSE